MKKIVTLLVVMLVDIIALQFVNASEVKKTTALLSYMPFILLFFTLAMTLFLFYTHYFVAGHEKLKNILVSSRKAATVTLTHEHKEKLPLDRQYEMIEMLRNQIIIMRTTGKSDGEIIRQLKLEQWDPQVIMIALGRVKQDDLKKAG
ncbi:MAG: hypothetical protein V1743_04570 [Nanoarchaeota archaeon]